MVCYFLYWVVLWYGQYKKNAERGLKYLLGVTHLGDQKHAAAAMQTITAANKELAKFCAGYAKRVLVSLGEESDDEYWRS